MDSLQTEDYLTVLAEMEQSWQWAVDKALSVRQDQLTTAKQVIVSLTAQIKQLTSQLQDREMDVDSLKRTLMETNMSFDSVREDMATLLVSTQKQMDEQSHECAGKLEAKDREIADLRTRHKLSIEELTRGARETLQDLEDQLESVRLAETESKRQLVEAEGVAQEHARKLKEWDRVSEKMSQELDDVKGKLKSSKYVNGKLREEIALWKKYAEKVEEERKTIRRDVELEKKVLNKYNQIDSHLRVERQQRNIIVDTMNRFGVNLLRDIKCLEESKQCKIVLMSVGTQTDTPCESEEKNEMINILKQKNLQLEEELRNQVNDMKNVSAQNTTLREVILGMKKERENWEKERDEMEDDARVSKLEESVRLIKSNLLSEQKDVCVWSALQGVKKEVSELKNRKVYNAKMVASRSSAIG